MAVKKGFIHLIPIVAIAAVLSIGVIGLVGTIRTQSVNESNILSSSDENRGRSENKGLNKGQGNQGGKGSKSQKPPTKTLEVEIENEGTPEATPSVRPGLKVRTNFPITVNPLTNEKIVTTPSGVHIVILPEVAIRNMIKAGFPVVTPPAPSSSPEATPSAAPTSTPSASVESSPALTVDQTGIVLTEVNNQPVYEIPAFKDQKFLGLVSIKIKIKGIVSAETGDILQIQKSLFDNILDLFSF